VKSVVRKANLWVGLLAVGVGAAAWVNGCSTPPGASLGSSSGDIGDVAMELQLATGVSLNTVAYTVSGPGGFSRTGTLDVSHSNTVSGVLSGLPTGTGFTISLTGTATDGTTTCLGSATFDVTARQTTVVAVHLTCHEAATTGSVALNGTVNICPVADGVTATPGEVVVGSAVSLAAFAHDTDNGPSPLSYQWAAASGAFSDPTSATPTFTCTVAGPVTLTVTVSDGDPAAGCTDKATAVVTCSGHTDAALAYSTATKIKHLVVIFGENISYDHYFGTYPTASNLAGEPTFTAAAGTPTPNNLVTPLDPTAAFAPIAGLNLLTMNPNLNVANGTGATNPFRLTAAEAETSDQGHNYLPEQEAYDNGLMDLFPKFTGSAGPPPGAPPIATTKGLVLAYFDGNTLGTFWSYAQQYAMNDNSYSTVFGPSTPGAVNLISGQTNGFDLVHLSKPPAMMSASHVVADGAGNFTLIGDTDPFGDKCSSAADQNLFTGKNVGDLLNAQKISWGWFNGGFDLTLTNANGTTGCLRSTPQTVPSSTTSTDYVPHHQPFQYYASTQNALHTRPSSVAAIGGSLETDGVTPEPANHQYDSHDFFDALAAGNLPAVVYLKAQSFQDGHPGNSNPVDEQTFVKNVVTTLQGSQEWASTAVVVLYDDSDGWYDHQESTIVNPSSSVADALNGTGVCKSGAQQGGAAPTTPLLGVAGVPVQGRCGYGTRQPLMVISPFAKKNFVDHTLTDQSSVLKFVEDNWLAGQRIQAGGSFDTIAGSIQNMFSF
jgi:phospholipase C